MAGSGAPWKACSIGLASGGGHTNTLEGFFSVLKHGLVGVYQHVGKHHLDRYLAEFEFRQNNREKLGINDTQRADLALQGMKGKSLDRLVLTIILIVAAATLYACYG